jgi:hypothetical protein
VEVSLPDVPFRPLAPAGLEDRAMPVLKRFKLLYILFHAAHGVADACQAHAGYQPHISTSDDSYVHDISSINPKSISPERTRLGRDNRANPSN